MTLLERESSLASLVQYAREARRARDVWSWSPEKPVSASRRSWSSWPVMYQMPLVLGACDGLFTPRPLGPLFDLADQLGGELLDLCRAGAPREQLFGALLRQVSEPGPLNVAVIEDVHWADEATIDLLRFLGRRVRNAAMLLIVTYRDDGSVASDPLRLALGELARQRTTRRVALAPLSAAAVRILAAEAG